MGDSGRGFFLVRLGGGTQTTGSRYHGARNPRLAIRAEALRAMRCAVREQ